jgi:hypothetical protein
VSWLSQIHYFTPSVHGADRQLLEKLIIVCIVKKLPSMHRTWKFITVFKTVWLAALLVLHFAWSILTSSSCVCQGVTNGLETFLFHISPMYSTCHSHLTVLDLISLIIFYEKCRSYEAPSYAAIVRITVTSQTSWMSHCRVRGKVSHW